MRRSVWVVWVWIVGMGAVGLGGCGAEGTVEVRTYPDSLRAAWSIPLSGRAMNAVQPAVAGDSAFVAADSLLRCLNTRTGTPCWTRPLAVHRSLGARAVRLDAERVYLNHYDTVWALDRTTGRVVWRTQVDDFDGVDLQRLAFNGTHLLLGGVGEVVRIRARDGGIDLRLPVPPVDTAAPPPFVFDPSFGPDGFIVAPSFYRRPTSRYFEGALRAFDSDGTLRWATETTLDMYTAPNGSPYTAGGGVHGTRTVDSLVVYTLGQTVAARDLRTGAVVWRAFFQEHGFGVGPSVADSTVYAGSTTGRLTALDLRTGQVRWHAQVEGGLLAPAVAHKEVVYQIDDGYGVLWAFDRRTGQARWHTVPPEHRTDRTATYRTPPGVGEAGLVVVGAKRVYGLGDRGKEELKD